MSIPEWFQKVGIVAIDSDYMHLYCAKCEEELDVTYLPDHDPSIPALRILCRNCHAPDGVYKFEWDEETSATD